MSRTFFPRGARLVVALAVSFLRIVHAQEPAAPKPTIELGKLSERLVEIDRGFEEKLAAMRRQVDAETADKKISEALAASLRWSLRASAFATSGATARDLISSMRIPPENPHLAKAAAALEESFNSTQKQRSILLAAGTEEIRRRYDDAMAHAETASVVLAARKEIEAARLAPDLIATDGRASAYNNILREATSVLEALEPMLRACEGGDSQQIRSAFQQLKYATLVNGSAGSPRAAAQERIRKVAIPFLAAVAKAEQEMVTALAANLSEAELNAKLDLLAQSESTAAAMSEPVSGSVSPRSTVYRLIITAVTAARLGEATRFKEALQAAETAARSVQGPDSGNLHKLLAALDRDTTEILNKARAAHVAQFRARLTAIANPAELDALAAEVRAIVSRRDGQDSENWNTLATELMALAAWWSGAESSGNEGRRAYVGSLSAEVNAVRQKIERDVIGRRMRLPELNTPPLASLPLSDALEALCDQFAEKQEWRRLYDLLTLRGGTQPQRAGQEGRDDTVIALRSFFAGQNLELAEQWSQAASAYLMVLQSASPRSPIKAAADRLKEIARDHPAAVSKGSGVDPRFRQEF